VDQNAGGVDDLAVGWTGCVFEIGENILFEGLDRGGHVCFIDGAIGDEPAEVVDGRPAGLHDRRSTEALDRLEQRREFEEAMDGRDGAILSLHEVIVSRGVATVIRE